MSELGYSQAVLDYFRNHAVNPQLAHELGVRGPADAITYPYRRANGSRYERRRPLAGSRTFQPKGEELTLWWPAPRNDTGLVLLCEGEPDALAALTALRTAPEDTSPILGGLQVAAVPGTGAKTERMINELRAANSQTVYLAFDADEAGRKATTRYQEALTAARVRAVPLPISEGRDLADYLRDAADDRALAELIAAGEESSEEEAPEVQVDVIGGLLDDVEATLRRWVVLPGEHETTALALWIAHTYALDGAHATPYPLIVSPEKRSGKSRLLEVLELLVDRPWRVTGASEAAMFRKIHQDHPTLLLDEIDAVFASNTERTEPLRALLNAGNRPGASVARCVGESRDKVVDFNIYCPKALAGIDNGTLPDTIRDRSITIAMARRKSDEPVERFRHRDAEALTERLRVQLQAWAEVACPTLHDARPALPPALPDRAADAWEPLLAIADLAGDEWGDRARGAAQALSGAIEEESSSTGALLLAAIRKAFGQRERVATSELTEAVNADDDLPFGGWWDGEGLNGRRLAKQLHRYRIKAGKWRDGESTVRGYERSQFVDAWERYAPTPLSEAPQAPQAPQTGDSATQKPHGNADVADVALVADPPGGVADVAEDGQGRLGEAA